MNIKVGKYRHYKGGVYNIDGICYHSETLEPLVIYTSTKDSKRWCRPVKEFFDVVKVNHELLNRFEKIEQ